MPPLAVGAIVTGERPLVLAVGHATTDGTAHEPQPDQPPAAVLRLPVQPARDRTALRPRRVESCYSIFSMPYCAYSLRPEGFWRVACCRVAACTAGRAPRYRRPGGWVRPRRVRGPPRRAAGGFLCLAGPRGGSGPARFMRAGAGGRRVRGGAVLPPTHRAVRRRRLPPRPAGRPAVQPRPLAALELRRHRRGWPGLFPLP